MYCARHVAATDGTAAHRGRAGEGAMNLGPTEIVGPIAQRDLEVETQKALLKAKQPKPKKGEGK